ncbi:unnamed protein product [Microthlaspi erraticum]|uniref:Carboxypeptidase n=1 Tax=Microthlaspi erraticum TaxID=1685480 RepID=A0A6D2IHG9_9BRAS|nr:unnamed protein product [Microthlaspi erraticum]
MRDLVTAFPGQPKVSFRHYAGYVTVDETNGRALFYWFFEAMNSPNVKPLVLWLNGEANVLFLESPAGVGFSYSNTSSDYGKLGDDFTARDTYAFLQKWFVRFPAYKENKFFIAGESYAGKYVPELAEVIYDKNKAHNVNVSLHINLIGILLGNPLTSYAEDWTGWVDYAWSHAVISDETYTIIKRSCNFSSDTTWEVKECKDGVDEILKQYKEIDQFSLYTPICIHHASKLDSYAKSKTIPRLFDGFDPCLDDYARVFYNRADVQKSLHATDGVHLKNWTICNGDTDGRVPVLATRYCINKLALPIKTTWRPWYHEKQVSGWFQEYEGLTFATFKGAGHDVPSFKPSESLAFFSAFLNGVPPPSARQSSKQI